MGDARAIYAQFASTPLKIRAASSTAAAAAAPAAAADIAVTSDAPAAVVDRGDDETGARACSPPAAAVLVSPSGPSPPSQAGAPFEAVTASEKQPSMKSTRKRKRSFAAAAVDGDPVDALPPKGTRRSKRVASAAKALEVSSEKSGAQLLTPPEDVRPAKRSRKATSKSSRAAKAKQQQQEQEQEQEQASIPSGTSNEPAEAEDESRSLLSAFALCNDDTEEEEKDADELPTPPKLTMAAKKRRLQKRPVTSAAKGETAGSPVKETEIATPDCISESCGALLKTETISGALFAAALNSLRSIQDEIYQVRIQELGDVCAPTNPFASVSRICMRIAQCEQLAESHSRTSGKPLSLLSRRRGLRPSGAKKKKVRFQSFDLSCIDLQYVRNAQVEGVVDKILYSYDDIMRHLASVQHGFAESKSNESEPTLFEARILRELVRTLSDKAMLTVDPDTLPTEAERIHLAAFSSRDPQTQHELQASRAYYAKEFKKLVPCCDGTSESSSSGAFLEELVSSLVSSSVRFKLRALFLEHDASESAGAPTVSMAAYTHQDFGSAIHCALQEALLYKPLATPALALVSKRQQLMEHFKTVEMDEFEHIEQFALARRFLRHHLKRAYEAPPSADGYTTRTWSKIERICGIARRYHFDDEAHLFPLESVKDFLAELEKEEDQLVQLETILGEFYDEQKEHHSKLRQQPCSECGEPVTRREPSGFIVCTLCASSFHLECLHLPPSFSQFADQYTCPSCFLGRR